MDRVPVRIAEIATVWYSRLLSSACVAWKALQLAPKFLDALEQGDTLDDPWLTAKLERIRVATNGAECRRLDEPTDSP